MTKLNETIREQMLKQTNNYHRKIDHNPNTELFNEFVTGTGRVLRGRVVYQNMFQISKSFIQIARHKKNDVPSLLETKHVKVGLAGCAKRLQSRKLNIESPMS